MTTGELLEVWKDMQPFFDADGDGCITRMELFAGEHATRSAASAYISTKSCTSLTHLARANAIMRTGWGVCTLSSTPRD